MTTIKIEPSHESQGDYVLIDVADFDKEKHQPYDEESANLLRAALASGELALPVADLLAAREELLARKSELDEREKALDTREAAVAEREKAVEKTAKKSAAASDEKK